jgi:predicted MFS family arabinose efflux permease
MAAFAGRMQQRFSVRATSVGGGVLVVVSMAAFAFGSLEEQILLVVLGLVLCGLGLGIATPGLTVVAAEASDPADYGVTSGMRTTLTQIGSPPGSVIPPRSAATTPAGGAPGLLARRP